MNTTSILPPWLQYVQAPALVAIPLVGSLIAGIGAWIALQQMRIARMKLYHDRYEKRLKIFEATHALLSEAVVNDTISDTVLKQFFVEMVVAPFHFNNDIVKYLDQLEKLASSVRVGQQAISVQMDMNLREKLQADTKKELLWLQQELQSGRLVDLFRPDLALDPNDAKKR